MIIKTIYLKSLDEGKIDNGGVVGLDTSNGFKEAKVLKGASNGERSKRQNRQLIPLYLKRI